MIRNIMLKLIDMKKDGQDIEKVLWSREKLWRAQLFTLSHGLDSPSEWYALNRKGYRKYLLDFFYPSVFSI